MGLTFLLLFLLPMPTRSWVVWFLTTLYPSSSGKLNKCKSFRTFAPSSCSCRWIWLPILIVVGFEYFFSMLRSWTLWLVLMLLISGYCLKCKIMYICLSKFTIIFFNIDKLVFYHLFKANILSSCWLWLMLIISFCGQVLVLSGI